MSLFRQEGVDLSRLELIIVDNAPEGSGADMAARLKEQAPFPVTYVHAPEPGVANARNAAMAYVRGKWMASLDDDQEALPNWLAGLIAARDLLKAEVMFGPVEGRLPDMGVTHAAHLAEFFSRRGAHEACILDGHWGMGNSMIATRLLGDAPFDPFSNELGGEDDFLFARLRDEGVVMGWAPQGVVLEHVPPHRATLKYMLRRSFAFGQGPTTIAARKSPPEVLNVIRWMAIGLAQTFVFGFITLLMYAARSPKRVKWLDKTAAGVGKVLWFSPFDQRFYGQYAR